MQIKKGPIAILLIVCVGLGYLFFFQPKEQKTNAQANVDSTALVPSVIPQATSDVEQTTPNVVPVTTTQTSDVQSDEQTGKKIARVMRKQKEVISEAKQIVKSKKQKANSPKASPKTDASGDDKNNTIPNF